VRSFLSLTRTPNLAKPSSIQQESVKPSVIPTESVEPSRIQEESVRETLRVPPPVKEAAPIKVMVPLRIVAAPE
jgi:hypothetical protein